MRRLPPVRCLSGHVISRASYLNRFYELKKQDVPMAKIFEELNLPMSTRSCCRNILMTQLS